MQIYIFYYKYLFILLFAALSIQSARAQTDTVGTDTTLNMDAVYDRPFLNIGKLPLAIGGYLEANSQYAATDGITEGLSFQMRRVSIFLSSTVARRIKFLAELEFEDGTKEINIEYAAMDLEL